MNKQIDLEFLQNEIHRLDPKLKEGDNGFSCALILLTSLVIGTSIKKITDFTDLEVDFVKKVIGRLRKNKIFVGRQVRAAEWFKKEIGAVAFWLDVCVAEGFVVRK